MREEEEEAARVEARSKLQQKLSDKVEQKRLLNEKIDAEIKSLKNQIQTNEDEKATNLLTYTSIRKLLGKDSRASILEQLGLQADAQEILLTQNKVF